MNFIKTFFYKAFFIVIAFAPQLHAHYSYRQASIEDFGAIQALFATATADDYNRVVILPEPFRSENIQANLTAGKLFVAIDTTTNNIVSILKMHIVHEEDLFNLLLNELRCSRPNRLKLESGIFSSNQTYQPTNTDFTATPNTLYLYLGGEFTRPDYRERGLNRTLEQQAYITLMPTTAHLCATNTIHRVNLLYGLVDGNNVRTLSIIAQFMPFATSLRAQLGLIEQPVLISFFAYKAYKPTFILNATGGLDVLPDQFCVPGRGCVLSFNLV